jgi:hypothetical protein
MKSSAFGLGFERSQSRLLHWLKIIILLATIASFISLLIGLSVIHSKAHLRYQANTTYKKRVLSFQFIAKRAIQDKLLSLNAYYFTRYLLQINDKVILMTLNLA